MVLMASMLTFAAAEEEKTWIGDATPENHDIRIVGMVEKPLYFTMAGLKAYSGSYTQTKDYNWMNSFPSTGIDTFTGIYIEDLMDIVAPKKGAKSVVFTAVDGVYTSSALTRDPLGVFWTDRDGNQAMLAWNGTAGRTDREIIDFDLPRFVIGQRTPDDVNRSVWVTRIVEVRVTAFNDMGGYDWAAEAVEALAEAGVTTGIGDGSIYGPDGNLSRAMFVTMLGRALDGKEPADADRRFPDVDYSPTSWYGKYVEWSVKEGLVQGGTDGNFHPNLNLLMEHMLLIAGRAGLKEIPEGIDVNAARFATRAEAAVIIYAMMQQLGE